MNGNKMMWSENLEKEFSDSLGDRKTNAEMEDRKMVKWAGMLERKDNGANE